VDGATEHAGSGGNLGGTELAGSEGRVAAPLNYKARKEGRNNPKFGLEPMSDYMSKIYGEAWS
jgi:hypothetical protein